MKLKLYWHIHHYIPIEPLTQPLKNRIEYIKKFKPKDEVPLRLKLLGPVEGKLPAGFVKIAENYVKARKAYDKAWKAYDKAWKDYGKAWEAYSNAVFVTYRKQIMALHKKECGCGYSLKRKTIFTKANGLVK